MIKTILAIVLIAFLLPLSVSCDKGESESAAETDSVYAKDFSLPALDGSKKFQLEDFKGKPLVINFWASWCAPCREEMPFFERTWRKYRKDGVVFLGIAVLDQEKSANEFLEQMNVSYVNLYDPSGETANIYGAIALPTTIFIDENGEIVRRSLGGFVGEEDEKKFTNYIEEMIR